VLELSESVILGSTCCRPRQMACLPEWRILILS